MQLQQPLASHDRKSNLVSSWRETETSVEEEIWYGFAVMVARRNL